MNIRELRKQLGATQSEFAERYQIPFRTVQNWENGVRKPPKYIETMLEQRVMLDLINRRTMKLPVRDPRKPDLPRRSDYIGGMSWLHAVQEALNEDVVFALDEALICQGLFGGRSDEYIIWLYGRDSLSRFNGVVVLGSHVSSYSILEKDGIKYTDLNRTISDAFANESILDMQGITEAVSRYYFANKESFEGLSVAPEYQDRFEGLAKEALLYYES